MIDDLGRGVALPSRCRRVVSLVPSLTEALAGSHPERIVGATDYCTHPANLRATRVRGTKNPNTAAIAALQPDVVVCNEEENREIDVRRLEALRIPVWVTRIDSVAGSVASLRRLHLALSWEEPAWLAAVEREWAEPTPERGTVAALIWRDPWMAVGRRTFASDVLRLLGLRNAVAGERYPRVEPASLRADVIALTSEPYPFTAADGPDAFPGRDVRLVDGRLLEWYGPSLVGAREELAAQLFG